jgi:hypothetical protein
MVARRSRYESAGGISGRGGKDTGQHRDTEAQGWHLNCAPGPRKGWATIRDESHNFD